MPRPKNSNPSVPLHVYLPPDARARLDLHLYSEAEERVPQGAYARFLSARIREFFEWRTLDLALYGMPKGYFVRGPRDMIDYLERKLKC